MSLGELVFIALFLGTLGATLRIVVHLAKGRTREARRLALRLALLLVTYLGVVVAVSLATPRVWFALGEEQRFDDWALTVVAAEPLADGVRLTLRVANRGRGRPQAARDVEVLLVAADGRRLAPRSQTGERSLREPVAAGASVETTRDYAVPDGLEILGVDVVHGAWPAWFVIGDRGSLWHRRPLVRLAPAHAPLSPI